MLDSLVRVSRRVAYDHYASVRAEARSSVRAGRIAPSARMQPRGESGRKRFPFNNFTCFLTLFSKCFSSFDHSTCALSVSGQYLALDEIYHPFRAAFPNNSTRRRSFTRARPPIPDGILTLHD